MKVTDLTVTKTRDCNYSLVCKVMKLKGGRQEAISTFDLIVCDEKTLQTICFMWLRKEVFNVVADWQWLRRCRVANPDDVVLSLRWDGTSDAPDPAAPVAWPFRDGRGRVTHAEPRSTSRVFDVDDVLERLERYGHRRGEGME
jgi:hypothetical protein